MKSSIRTIFRHLWRQKLFTALNIIGLSIGIAACWIIYGIVSYEYSFEKELPERENTYRIISVMIWDEKESYGGGISAPIYQEIRKQVPQLTRVIPVYDRWTNSVQRPAMGNQPAFQLDDPKNIVETDTNYFAMVPYTWLAGTRQAAFDAPENVVLTESRARKYFGNMPAGDLLGKQLIYNDSVFKTVSGIVKDLDYASEFSAKEFFAMPYRQYDLTEWTNTNGSDRVYVQTIAAADTAKVMSVINSIVDGKMKEYMDKVKPTWKFTRWFEIMPLADSHFATHLKEWEVRKASKPVLYGLMVLGGFLLLLACINYINLSTAQIPQRRKEIGVRKTLGSGRRQLMRRVFLETLITVSLAAVAAIMLSKLGFRLLNDIIPPESADFANGFRIMIVIILIVLLVTAISGLYPAWLIAKVQPVSIMRGNTFNHSRSSWLTPRKMLIVLQFVIAQVFISGALIMGAQLTYTLKKDLGFNKEAIVHAEIPWKLMREPANREKHFALANELRRLPGISVLSLGREPMSTSSMSTQYQYQPGDQKEAVKRQVFRKEVDTNYIRLYDLQLVAGRNLTASDTIREFVINETAVKAYGFASADDAIGKMLGQRQPMYPIVGVVKDFHVSNFHNSIDPVALMTNKSNLYNFNIRLRGTDPTEWKKTIAAIEKQWARFYPGESFSFRFYDEYIAAMYKEEQNTAYLINLATIISIVISCLGLFGLATLTAFQKAKEISIRKILGASMGGIITMLSSDFIKLIVVALVIASPIAWWAMNKWLEDFAYRIHIQWWMFGIAGLAAIVIALLTVSYQSVRAALANPVDSLRNE